MKRVWKKAISALMAFLVLGYAVSCYSITAQAKEKSDKGVWQVAETEYDDISVGGNGACLRKGMNYYLLDTDGNMLDVNEIIGNEDYTTISLRRSATAFVYAQVQKGEKKAIIWTDGQWAGGKGEYYDIISDGTVGLFAGKKEGNDLYNYEFLLPDGQKINLWKETKDLNIAGKSINRNGDILSLAKDGKWSAYNIVTGKQKEWDDSGMLSFETYNGETYICFYGYSSRTVTYYDSAFNELFSIDAENELWRVEDIGTWFEKGYVVSKDNYNYGQLVTKDNKWNFGEGCTYVRVLDATEGIWLEAAGFTINSSIGSPRFKLMKRGLVCRDTGDEQYQCEGWTRGGSFWVSWEQYDDNDSDVILKSGGNLYLWQKSDGYQTGRLLTQESGYIGDNGACCIDGNILVSKTSKPYILSRSSSFTEKTYVALDENMCYDSVLKKGTYRLMDGDGKNILVHSDSGFYELYQSENYSKKHWIDWIDIPADAAKIFTERGYNFASDEAGKLVGIFDSSWNNILDAESRNAYKYYEGDFDFRNSGAYPEGAVCLVKDENDKLHIIGKKGNISEAFEFLYNQIGQITLYAKGGKCYAYSAAKQESILLCDIMELVGYNYNLNSDYIYAVCPTTEPDKYNRSLCDLILLDQEGNRYILNKNQTGYVWSFDISIGANGDIADLEDGNALFVTNSEEGYKQGLLWYGEKPACLENVRNGWVTIDGMDYWYENGVRQGYDPDDSSYRGKEIYDPDSDAWYWLDNVQQGAKAISKDVYQESDAGPYADRPDGTGKWVRYDENGHMIKGWHTNEKGTYYFDYTYGAMLKGWQTIDSKQYYFDEVTGILQSEEAIENGWLEIDGKSYWYENGVRQGYDPDNADYRGKEIYDPDSDAWYWLDNVQQGAKAVSKDVYQESYSAYPDRPDGTGKWVRYDENGHMVKGWQTTEAGTYYFETITGAMAKGNVTIDGETYYFDEVTGIRK